MRLRRNSVVAVIALFILIGQMPVLAADPASYAGAQACASCHPAQTRAWQGSHHARAMQPARPSAVLGDFSGATLQHAGVTTTFFRDGDRYMVRTDGTDRTLHDYQIAYTFGVYPLQQYLIPFPDGRYQALGIAWDSRKREQGGQRWFSLYPDQALRGGDRLHWTGRDQTWNYQCADCHSTDLRKNFDLAANTYATTYSDVNVACEACHGPGSRHIAWATLPTPDPQKGLVVPLTAGNRGTWVMNPATGIAQRTNPASAAELNACGGCHARRSVIASGTTGATQFLDAYRPALLEPGLYHADGQIDGEVFEYGSFVQSKMFKAGVTCTNCHEPHAATLRAEGNTLCVQCHAPQVFDTAAHHHHRAGGEGAQCTACHMPAKTYMEVDVRRDHSFRVPRPDLSLKIGVPNACSQCHQDKPPQWAAGAVAAWYPLGRQTTVHYGIALDAGRRGAPDAEARLDALIQDKSAPAIARATALQVLLPYVSGASQAAILTALRDPEPLVREAAPFALNGSSSQQVLDGVASLLDDQLRGVRIQAARALADVDPQMLTAHQRDALASATRELTEAEMINADRPEAHLNLGQLAVRRGDAAEAEAQYRTALRLDPNFVPTLIDLADLYRMRGMDQQGVPLLRQAITVEPGNADAHHALGLLLVRQRDPSAMDELRQANALAPDNARYAYVYAVALHSSGSAAPAMTLLEQTHQRHPTNRDVLGALISFSQQKGDAQTVLRYAQELLALEPGNVQLERFVRQLRSAMPK